PPGAVHFLNNLQGKEVHGQVLDVLLPHRLILLEVPDLFQQMLQLGLARQVPESLFRSLLKRYLAAAITGLGPGAVVLPRALPKQEPPGLDYFYPQLQLGVTEPVVVTQVCHPHRIHCQLRSLSQEIHRLSDSMAQVYHQGSLGTGDENSLSATWEEREAEENPDKPGAPCASCGLDGHWYRALLLEMFRPQRCAQVLHVDYGRKELVSCSSLRYLLPEYFRMPVVTYPCALYGLWDGGRGWTRSQVGDLKALILGQAVNAKIEFYCAFEHVYYVTLYGEDGINLNCVFGVRSCCLADRFLQNQGVEEEEEEEEAEAALHPQSPWEEMDEELSLPALRSIRLKMNAFYDAQVEFVKSPSEFWIRLRKHSGTFSKLMRRMCSFYSSATKLDGVVLKPEPDDLCCVKWKENGYFRAIVTRLNDTSVDLFLVDRGNSENVDWSEVRMLLPQFRRLPILALKCTLADIWPLGKSWSQEAISFFKKTVLHKELVIHILDRQNHQYVIEILDESRTGEENISKVIAQAGYAKYQEFEMKDKPPVGAYSPWPVSSHCTTDNNNVSFLGKAEKDQKAKREQEAPSVSEALAGPTVVTNVSAGPGLQEKGTKTPACTPPACTPLAQSKWQMNAGPSCKEELEVGSTVEVKVSHVENPGYFWCQLTRNIQGFRTLMSDIQDYCKNTATPYQGLSPACLAKRTVSGKWARAVIDGAPSAEQIKVTFIDYGDKDTVPVKNVYSTREEFLTVKAQAFQCSLYNLIQPSGPNPLAWDEEAIQTFNKFIDNAWEGNLELKCTIFALASIHDAEYFHVVDLLTPFQSACCTLVEKGLAKPVNLQKPLEPSVRLHSYYYSTHDVKIGSEEAVYITHVDQSWTFYCQLARNAKIFEQLSCHIAQLRKASLHLEAAPLGRGTLCLAKYIDENWYRGIVMEKEPSKIFFVDFGNVYTVANDDLLPIPGDAYDVLLSPMQAVKCTLSDIPDRIPEEVTTWFQDTILDKSLKALVVAKDSDGRLIVELYDGSVQINAAVTEKLGLLGYKGKARQKEAPRLCAAHTLEEPGENRNLSLTTEYLSKPEEDKLHSVEFAGDSCTPTVSSACRELTVLQSPTKTNAAMKYQNPLGHQNRPASPLAKQTKEGAVAKSPLKAAKLETVALEKKPGDCNQDAPLKYSEFPRKTVKPGFKTTVYVSHINDLSDFYVQLLEDEAVINHLSESLNDSRRPPDHYAGPPLQTGDVVCAMFPEDNLWYRAVVVDRQPNDLFSVQFIDYGNVSVVCVNKIGRLDMMHATLPGLCIHCSLEGPWALERTNQKEMMHYFSQRTDGVQIRCEFVQFQGRWEVILADECGIIAEYMISRYDFNEKSEGELTAQAKKGTVLKSADKPDIDTSVFLNWYDPEMKVLRVYASVIDGPEYFWCQFANTEKLQFLEIEVQAAGHLLATWRNCITYPHIGDPCIVRYREDGQYYRALVTRICEDDLISVRLVDFGNTEDCVDPKAIWNLPAELLLVPMQAFPCCLSGFNVSEGACPPEGNDYFFEIVTEDVLELTILDIKRDICGIPLAIVDLRSKGESINEKMKKYSRRGMTNCDPAHDKCLETKGALGYSSPDVGFQIQSGRTGQKTLYSEPLADELSKKPEKGFNIMEANSCKARDQETKKTIFEAFESPHKDTVGPGVLDGKAECHVVDQTKVDEYLNPGQNKVVPRACEARALLKLNALELPLGLEGTSKEFLELESELELSRVGMGDQELTVVPPMVPLTQCCDRVGVWEAEKQPELELPTEQPSRDGIMPPLPLKLSRKAQEPVCVEDTRKPSCADGFDDPPGTPLQRWGQSRSPQTQMERKAFEGELTDCKKRGALSPLTSLTPLFPEKEPREGWKHSHTVPARASAQPENTYTLKGFTVGSKCVVWSTLRHTWSMCEIMEIAEEGTRVLNLSNGLEETVDPDNVWDGIPDLAKGPSEVSHRAIQNE
ncbi:tudor domain-containing protein 6, partial [Echinops telfairi]|uniref:Tudor domain-containing protein 6 n=1 Tax=Echinops telfairi TaxID=9371 RepID=A0ABM0IYN1_ECHTE